MTTADDVPPYELAPAVAHRVLVALQGLADARAARDELIRATRAAGVPARQVGTILRRELTTAGWDPAVVTSRDVGFSDGNVRRVLDRRD